ncbi:MAG: hypothetical protein JXB62_19430 [Pirellulales bacterium]|nr:hypothetical protein [Pirellulales bacterium]
MRTHHQHREGEACFECGCCRSIGRRDFMTVVGAGALAAHSMLSQLATAAPAGDPAEPARARIRAVFVRPETDRYWMGWPGASYDIQARQADYTKLMTDAAKKEDIDLQVTQEPLADASAMNALIAECTQDPPDGVILIVMSLNAGWQETNRFVTERPKDLPTIVFSPMGTSFTGHLQATRNQAKTLVGATQKIEWLAEAIHLLKTNVAMKTSRLLIVNGNNTEEKVLDVIGTTLRYIPLTRWEEGLKSIGDTDEMKQLAVDLAKRAKAVREPSEQDIFKAAKNYFVAKKLMADERCDGISLNCLGLVGSRRIDAPPCIAWMLLNDEGSVGCCECDWNSAIALRLCALLAGRPGFMQDPCPNTVAGTLMGAHCSSPTRLRGFDQEPEPVILRSHSESAIGVSPQVIWPIGEPVTVIDFDGPGKLILGTGKVVANIETPPAGGCRTSVELEMDDVADPRDCKGFHQPFIYGRLDRLFEQYCQLSGIEVVPIA